MIYVISTPCSLACGSARRVDDAGAAHRPQHTLTHVLRFPDRTKAPHHLISHTPKGTHALQMGHNRDTCHTRTGQRGDRTQVQMEAQRNAARPHPTLARRGGGGVQKRPSASGALRLKRPTRREDNWGWGMMAKNARMAD
eukprot:5577016-Prymnesium_polylepis.2